MFPTVAAHGNGAVSGTVLSSSSPSINFAAGAGRFAVAFPHLIYGSGRNSIIQGGSVHMRTSSIPLPGFPWGEDSSKTFINADLDLSGDSLTESQLVAVALRTLGNFDFEGKFIYFP